MDPNTDVAYLLTRLVPPELAALLMPITGVTFLVMTQMPPNWKKIRWLAVAAGINAGLAVLVALASRFHDPTGILSFALVAGLSGLVVGNARKPNDPPAPVVTTVATTVTGSPTQQPPIIVGDTVIRSSSGNPPAV